MTLQSDSQQKMDNGAVTFKRPTSSFQTTKRGFKEKLMETLSNAQEVCHGAVEEDAPTKQSILIDCLVEGNVQTFVDLFYMTAPEARPSDEELVAKGVDPERYESSAEIALESIPFVKVNLAAAEHANRAAEYRIVYAAFKNVAQFLADSGKYRKAIKFFDKCLEISRQEEDAYLELETTLSLGLTHERCLDSATCITYFEKHVTVASFIGEPGADANGRALLIRALTARSSELAEKGDVKGSVAQLKRSLQVAEDGRLMEAQGAAHMGLGAAYRRAKDTRRALRHYLEFRSIALATADPAAQAEAHGALAEVYQAGGDVAAASESLAALLTVAQASGNLHSQAHAAASLGVLAQEAGCYAEAAEHFAVSFQAARALRDLRMLAVARVNLGLARGAAASGLLLGAVARNDLPVLLGWKLQRAPMDGRVEVEGGGGGAADATQDEGDGGEQTASVVGGGEANHHVSNDHDAAEEGGEGEMPVEEDAPAQEEAHTEDGPP